MICKTPGWSGSQTPSVEEQQNTAGDTKASVMKNALECFVRGSVCLCVCARACVILDVHCKTSVLSRAFMQLGQCTRHKIYCH